MGGVVSAGGGGASAGVVLVLVGWAVAFVGGDDGGAACGGAASAGGHGVPPWVGWVCVWGVAVAGWGLPGMEGPGASVLYRQWFDLTIS